MTQTQPDDDPLSATATVARFRRASRPFVFAAIPNHKQFSFSEACGWGFGIRTTAQVPANDLKFAISGGRKSLSRWLPPYGLAARREVAHKLPRIAVFARTTSSTG